MLLLSRSMSRRTSHTRSLSLALALGTLALAGSQAHAGHVAPSQDGIPRMPVAHVADNASADLADLRPTGLDAERALQGVSPAAKPIKPQTTDERPANLSPLPANGVLDASPNVELRGKSLDWAMSDLPQVGSSPRTTALSLDFWDDATSARSAVDNRTIGPVESVPTNSARVAGNQSNVMIPLPAAALSALSVFGGIGCVAGMRRIIRGGK